MSHVNVSVSGPAEGARRASGARGGNRPRRQGRWSARGKASVVLELFRGADQKSTRRKRFVTAATLSEWRDAFLAGVLRHSRSGRKTWSMSKVGA